MERWQPKTIVRYVESIGSSTAPAFVATDLGYAYLKALGNPEGPHALVSEYVGTQLASWFGLPTFDFALIDVTEVDEIPLHGGGLAEAGPAFITRKEDGAPWSGQARQLRLLVNPEVIPRLIVFDTWIRNRDRHSYFTAGELVRIRKNTANVFLSSESSVRGKLSLRVMDHTHCFASGASFTKKLDVRDNIQDTMVYGEFSEFRPYIDRELVRQATRELSRLRREVVEPMIARVPRAWDLDADARSALLELILRRAEFVAETIEGRLFRQSEAF